MIFGIMSCVYTYKDDRKTGRGDRGDSLDEQEVESTEGPHGTEGPESQGEKDPLLDGPDTTDDRGPSTLSSSDM